MDFDPQVKEVLVILYVQPLSLCEMYEHLHFGSSQLLITAKNLGEQDLYMEFCSFSHCTFIFPPVICFSICTTHYSLIFCLFEKSFVYSAR